MPGGQHSPIGDLQGHGGFLRYQPAAANEKEAAGCPMVVVLSLGVALGDSNTLQMRRHEGQTLRGGFGEKPRCIAELPSLKGMEQPNRRFLAAEPVAATVHGVGVAPAPAPGIQPIEIPAVATEAPGTRQERGPAPARKLPTALDIACPKVAAAPVLAAIRETLARGWIKKPIRWGSIAWLSWLNQVARPTRGIGSREAGLTRSQTRLS